MGNSYEFKIPYALTFKSIIFDALDSSFDKTSNCLKTYKQCCTISGTTMSVNSANPSPISSCTVTNEQTENCRTTTGGALFQFVYKESLSTAGGVGTLTLSNCKFQHFFYDFTTLIGLTEGHGKVVITDTTFEKFSN